jgi:RNA polymerase sigma factor (sigma-70 family)
LSNQIGPDTTSGSNPPAARVDSRLFDTGAHASAIQYQVSGHWDAQAGLHYTDDGADLRCPGGMSGDDASADEHRFGCVSKYMISLAPMPEPKNSARNGSFFSPQSALPWKQVLSKLNSCAESSLASEDRYAFATTLAASHGERLRRFLAARLRAARHDIPDLVQEVYMRLLRVGHPESIRNPEAYLFTIANHVLHQYALRQSALPESSDVMDAISIEAAEADPVSQADMQQRLQELDQVLAQLSYKAQAALILYRRDGFSLEEVAKELGISLAMVKKHLVKAILHCRRHLPADE